MVADPVRAVDYKIPCQVESPAAHILQSLVNGLAVALSKIAELKGKVGLEKMWTNIDSSSRFA